MSSGRAYRRAYAREPYVPSAPARPSRAVEAESRRSNAAVPVAIAVVVLGLYLGQYSFLAPAGLGLVLLFSGASFLSARLNPLSPHFYLSRKPSWLAVGVVLLGGLLLFYYAYNLLLHQVGPLTPRL